MYDEVELCTNAARTLGYEGLRTVMTMSGVIPDGESEFGTLCSVELDGGRLIQIFLPKDGGPPTEIDNGETP